MGVRVKNSMAINLLPGFLNLQSKLAFFLSILSGQWSVFMDVYILGHGTSTEWKLIAMTLNHTIITKQKKNTSTEASKLHFM